MESIKNIELLSLADTTVSLAVAFFLGGLIGLERQIRQRTAGLRTNVLVAVAAALFVDIGNRMGGHQTASHIVAYVVSGIGFLGAGVIMREGGNVRGLNTAATLWGSAAVGACAGADLILEAAVASLFFLAANTLLRPVADRINRQPMRSDLVEVVHAFLLIARQDHQKDAMSELISALNEFGAPLQDLIIEPFGEDRIKIEAILASSAIPPERVEAAIARLQSLPFVFQAFWAPKDGDMA